MKIKRNSSNQLRNNEHFQCHTEVKILIGEYDPVVLKIEGFYNGKYLPFYVREDDAILQIRKSLHIESRTKADREWVKHFVK